MLRVGRGSRPLRRVRLGATPLGVAESTPDPETLPGCMPPRLARRTLLGSLPVLGGVGLPNLTLAAASPTHAACLPSGFPGSVHAVFGFGAAGVVAAEAAAAACRSMSDHEEPGWLAALGGMQSGPNVANVVLASEWSFSVLCCDGADGAALSCADTIARALARRGHMAVLIGVGPSAAPLAATMQAAGGQDQPARLHLPVPDPRDAFTPVLAASTAVLLSSVACRGTLR